MKYLRFLIVSSLILIMTTALAKAEKPKKKPPKRKDREGKLKPGDIAPAFQIKDMTGKRTVSLSSLKGKPVVLFFGSCT